MEKEVEVEEIDCAVDDVKMGENEVIRIIITKTKDNTMNLSIKSDTDSKIQDISIFEVVGLIETAKSDMLAQNQAPKEMPQRNVDIVLVQEDFDIDKAQGGQLAASGKKVGDILSVPEQIAAIREMAIKREKEKGSIKEDKSDLKKV